MTSHSETTQYDFDSALDRQSTESIKWNYYDKDVLPMWVADMDFRSPPGVIRALQERVAHGVFGYGFELEGLSETIVERMETRYDWHIQPDDIVYLPGVVTGFNLACHAFAGPGGGVLIQPPVYMPFLSAPRNARAVRQDCELVCDDGLHYSIDWDEFENAFTEQTKMFLLCSPHNPVGRVWTRDELARMAEISLRNGTVICSDEIHCDLVYADHRHIPMAALDAEIAQRTMTLMAPSKTFNVPGLYCSFAIIQNPELRKQYTAAKRGLVGEVNLLGLVAARAAYREGGEWLDQLLATLQSNRDFLVNWIRRELPELKVGVAEGTYLAWVDCRGLNLNEAPADFFLREARVGYNDGAAFGKGGAGFIRINFGCPRWMLEDALERTRRAIRK